MLDKLAAIHERYLSIETQINDPAVMQDMKAYIKLNKDYKELQPIIEGYKKYKVIVDGIEACRSILDEEKDEEMRSFAKEEMDSLIGQRETLEEEIRLMLIPSDPQDVKNAVVEIRAGSGGDEASIFAGDLYRMYVHYCENKNWKIEPVSQTEGTMGGFKEIIFEVKGDGVYGLLKYESGVHRVQRVPDTETKGRIHTSAASVAVLPEADEFEVDLKQ
ncbi:MAG TPA: PCRF domain-containing protein, partial [Bacteroidales bacterium]|nr:PCRF domain-containing protein [Bacteroidales bacterium]